MSTLNWYNEVPFAITVCDEKGIVLEMNEASEVIFTDDGGRDLIGQNLLDCHPEDARKQILEIIKTETSNIYTIEKDGQKKLIYQCPWFSNGKLAGLVELSMVLPNDMPHFVRN